MGASESLGGCLVGRVGGETESLGRARPRPLGGRLASGWSVDSLMPKSGAVVDRAATEIKANSRRAAGRVVTVRFGGVKRGVKRLAGAQKAGSGPLRPAGRAVAYPLL